MRPLLMLAVPLVLFVGGCTNLDAVKSASTKLVTASKNWDAVAGELNATCQRQQQYNKKLTDCASPAAATKGLKDANTILTNYFQALADTASDQNFTVQPGLDALAKSAAAVPGANKSQVTAVSDLVSLLAKWATQAAREKALEDLIGKGVPSSEHVIDLMDTQVVLSLTRDLSGEQDFMDETFLKYIYPDGGVTTKQLHAMCETGPRAYALNEGPFLAALEYCRRFGDLDAKSKAVADYQKSLKTAHQTLDDLASSKSKLTSKELITQLYNDGKDLDSKVEAVSKAFVKGASS